MFCRLYDKFYACIGPVAQLVEQRTFNPSVVSSNLTRLTLPCNDVSGVCEFASAERAFHGDNQGGFGHGWRGDGSLRFLSCTLCMLTLIR